MCSAHAKLASHSPTAIKFKSEQVACAVHMQSHSKNAIVHSTPAILNITISLGGS